MNEEFREIHESNMTVKMAHKKAQALAELCADIFFEEAA